MRTTPFVAIAAGTVLAVGIGSSASAVDPGKADLAVLHGIPGLTVDVYVEGALTLDDFAPGDLAGPLSLDPGTYTVAITASDAADDSAPVLGPIDITLEADMSYTAAAHLTEAGDPTVSLFTNDISAAGSGEGRLTVRHIAAAPEVDILADGSPVFTGLANPDEAMADLPAGTYPAAVALAGTTEPVLGPADVEITEGVNTIVYAWGSAADTNLALAVQSVDLTMGSPDEVQAGLPVGNEGSAPWALVAAAIAALALAGVAGSRALARR
jgi:hypothetical protein